MFVIIFSSEDVFASSTEPILIPLSPDQEEVIFDGKWTFYFEWKKTGLITMATDDTRTMLRHGHFGDFLYIFVDSIDDYTLNKGMDKATVCFDGENNKSNIPDKNDYCFSVALGQHQGTVFQGGSISAISGHFEKISNPDNFIAISSVSDDNDRYTKTPHPSYEFRIPLDLLKRSDNYGFYLSVYDAGSDTFHTFPKETMRENLLAIPSPSQWGDIISPDKSLPELNLPIMVFTVLIFTMILVQSKVKIGIFQR